MQQEVFRQRNKLTPCTLIKLQKNILNSMPKEKAWNFRVIYFSQSDSQCPDKECCNFSVFLQKILLLKEKSFVDSHSLSVKNYNVF